MSSNREIMLNELSDMDADERAALMRSLDTGDADAPRRGVLVAEHHHRPACHTQRPVRDRFSRPRWHARRRDGHLQRESAFPRSRRFRRTDQFPRPEEGPGRAGGDVSRGRSNRARRRRGVTVGHPERRRRRDSSGRGNWSVRRKRRDRGKADSRCKWPSRRRACQRGRLNRSRTGRCVWQAGRW